MSINQIEFRIGNIVVGNNKPILIISGPCMMESRQHAIDIALYLKTICGERGLNFIFKTSFDKANRTSLNSIRGIGLKDSLTIFDEIRSMDIPVITDIHTVEQCDILSSHVDVLQIPAFLCRQTDLLIAAAKTNLPINVKKGQFLAPWDMEQVRNKIKSSGNDRVMLCERGTTFGYNTLVNDFTGLQYMKENIGNPVIFDATHSVQKPGGHGACSGGNRDYVPSLCRAATAVGVAGIFIETHDDPDNAPSDGPNMVKLCDMKGLLKTIKEIDELSCIGKIKNENINW